MINHLKKVLIIVLALALILTTVLSVTAAGTYFLYEGIYYGIDENGEAYVHSSNGEAWDVVIREKFLNKYDVTEIEEYAFFENNTVEILSFYEASHLKKLGECAFARCSKLKKVDITSSIQEMGMGVFDSCTALESICFREGSLKDIPRQCCYGCTTLSTVTFMNATASIGPLAFGNCSALKQIEIPDSVTQIADNAFDGCDNLVIFCAPHSYADLYAQANDIPRRYTVPYFINGDTDGDDEVTILDATRVQRVLAGFSVNDPEGCALRGDVNGNGLDILDATFIQRWLVNFDDPYGINEPVPLESIA